MNKCTNKASWVERSASPCTSTNDEDASEAFEDAQSEVDKDQGNSWDLNEYDAVNEIKVASPFRYDASNRGNNDPCGSLLLRKDKRSYSVAGCESNFSNSHLRELPPLETFLDDIKFNGLDLSEGICGSLAASLELENDVLPSTPLTDEQLRHADSVLKDEMVQGVPINRIEVEQSPLGIENIIIKINMSDITRMSKYCIEK